MSQTNSQRLQYLLWAARRRLWGQPNLNCPACACQDTQQVGSKYLITSLWECRSCWLRFRSPKEDQETNRDYYQDDYSEGFTTTVPDDKRLEQLIATGFLGSEGDYRRYISVLQAAGQGKQKSVLDFGASWGYGSWQLRSFGYNVWSYEIGKRRADYARQKLGCHMVESVDELPGRVDCMFSAHVIEHLPDPSIIWTLADKVLNDEGMIVCFCPNGNPDLESTKGRYLYSCLWGKHHPMVITPRFLIGMSARLGFEAKVFSAAYGGTYQGSNISRGVPDAAIIGDELCMIARRCGSP